MAAVTQTIPQYIQGVSQQSDIEMVPGFLKEIQNAVPDITFGLQKRPGSKYLFTLPSITKTTGTDGYWFSIIREADQPYFGVILPAVTDSNGNVTTNATIKIWQSTTGVECTVNFITHSDGTDSATYLNGATLADYKALTVEKSTIILNRKSVVAISTTTIPSATITRVSTYADLPTGTINPAIVYQIINSEDTTKDDYYVQYIQGAWQEVAKPGISDGFKVETAPHVLRKINDTTFEFSEANFSTRQVGDDITNPHPTFVNETIQDCFSYFNRIGFLSNANVILSASLKPDFTTTALQEVNFYAKSAQVLIASDPVDLNANSIQSVLLTNVLPAPQGLILFSNNEQFILYADQGVITPQTAIIKSLGNYELSSDIPPVELGEEFYYVNKTARYTRTMQMITRGMENDPLVNEASKLASEYVPSSINNLVANPQNRFIAMSDRNQEYMWFYKTYTQGQQRVMSSWFKWKFPGNVLSCVFTSDQMFTILATEDDKVCISRTPLNKAPDSDLLIDITNTDDNLAIGPYMDLWTNEYHSVTYDAILDRTFITPTSDYPVIDDPDYTPLLILSDTSPSAPTNPNAGMMYDLTIESNGSFSTAGQIDHLQEYFILGYRFEMVCDLPNTYFQLQNGPDNTASLIVSRYKFACQDSGVVTFQINDPDNVQEFEDVAAVTNTEYYKANALPVFRQIMFTVPIYRRNEYFRFRIYSNSPFPATLNKMSWEGQYAPRFYQRG